MFCRACSTRLEDGQQTCPNCGRVARDRGVPYRIAPKPTLSPPRSLKGTAPRPAELELYDEVDLEPTATREAAVAAAPEPARAGFVPLQLDPIELRARVAENPELLEPGLRVFTDRDGRPTGAGFATEVGEIDLLARDPHGSLVVVVIADRRRDHDPVAEVLERIGWVRKHLSGEGRRVRGILLLEPPFEDLTYAATAVAGTVAFKTYRVSLSFDDIAL
jgi:hypothetical protein